MLRKISQDRALELAQAALNAQRREATRDGSHGVMALEAATVLGDIRQELPQLREEIARLKRRNGALGSEHPEEVTHD